MSLGGRRLISIQGKDMTKKNNNTALIIAILAGILGCAGCAFCFGLILVTGYFSLIYPVTTVSVRVTQVVGGESTENLPKLSLLGIWHNNSMMAAGWADRYHFYPSGSFRFYPNQMTCIEEKMEKVGTWELENTRLTLRTTKQIIHNYEIDPGGLCRVIGSKEVELTIPIIEQFTVVDLGTQEGDIYPSITIDDQRFWKFSDDASSYGDEKFPEPEYP
jgi:hypothetical protein